MKSQGLIIVEYLESLTKVNSLFTYLHHLAIIDDSKFIMNKFIKRSSVIVSYMKYSSYVAFIAIE